MSEQTTATAPWWHDNPEDWRRARDWARDLLALEDWILLDTETTGLGPDAEIVKISVVAPDGQVLLSTHVRPTVPIPPEATRVHGITDAMVADAPAWPEVWPSLKGLLAGKLTIAYNAAFDERILCQTARRHGTERPELRWDCAMEWYAMWMGEWSDYHGNYRWPRLPRSSHDALGDCMATLAVIRNMAEGRIQE